MNKWAMSRGQKDEEEHYLISKLIQEGYGFEPVLFALRIKDWEYKLALEYLKQAYYHLREIRRLRDGRY